MIPPIRLLYSDDNNDDLSIQLQIADHQSSLSWETVLNILDDEIRLEAIFEPDMKLII